MEVLHARRTIASILADSMASPDELRTALHETHVALQDTAANLCDLVIENASLMTPVINVPLSYTEGESIRHLLQVTPDETTIIVVASRIADEHGFTRSVIVNALRKLQSAGIIQSHSLGMKGTCVKWLDRPRAVALVGLTA